MKGPAMTVRVIKAEAALRVQLFEIAQNQTADKIPPDAQQYHRADKISAFEQCVPPDTVRDAR